MLLLIEEPRRTYDGVFLYHKSVSHEQFLRRSLELADLGRGNVGNGALVGAVLVREEKIIAEGFHKGFGHAHAERDLLDHFPGEILSTDTLYVNLEPCCHQGKTPPCTDIILKRGIKNVVFGMEDPDPRVRAKGRQLLEKAGVAVLSPLLRAQCEWLNRGYISTRTKARPWITLKRAQMIDGRTEKADGSMLKITTGEQDIWSHQVLRARHDAILVGAGTVLSDDPLLTNRHQKMRHIKVKRALTDEENKLIKKNDQKPWKIILDAQFCCPTDRRVFTSSTVLFVSEKALSSKSAEKALLLERGVDVRALPVGADGCFVWDALMKDLLTPRAGFDGITSVLVEGGTKTWSVFRDQKMVDEEVVLVGK